MMLIFSIIIVGGLVASTGLYFYLLLSTRNKSPKKAVYTEPSDMNKEPTKLRHKMDKVYLKLEFLTGPSNAINPDIDHRKEYMEDVDVYHQNLKPYIAVVNNSLDMPKDKFAHLGYYFQGDLFDLDGKHLYESKRWVSDLTKHLPKKKKGILDAFFNAINLNKLRK